VVEFGNLVLSIADGGRGFDPEAGAEAGLGLVTMRTPPNWWPPTYRCRG